MCTSGGGRGVLVLNLVHRRIQKHVGSSSFRTQFAISINSTISFINKWEDVFQIEMSDNSIPHWQLYGNEQISFCASDNLSKLRNVISFNLLSGILGHAHTTSTKRSWRWKRFSTQLEHFVFISLTDTFAADGRQTRLFLKKTAASSGWSHHELSAATESHTSKVTSLLPNGD